MYDLANVNEDGGSVVLSPHLSAFLIAAIKVLASTSPIPHLGRRKILSAPLYILVARPGRRERSRI